MAKNPGKIFEEDFQNSIPPYCLIHRLVDPPQSFHKNNNLRFSWKNPCDYHVFDSKNRTFWALELKSTKAKSLSFEDINIDGKQPNKEIHKHQIEALIKYGKFNGVQSGFILNFRDEKNRTQKTYYQNIKDFVDMTSNIGKKSFNERDLINYNAVRINGNKKITRYVWDFDSILNSI